MSGRHYTLVIFPDAPAAKTDADAPRAEGAKAEKKLALDVIADDLQPPSAGKARVRVINAAAGTDDIEVFLRGQKDALFNDVDFKEAIAYKEVDPVKTTIEWRTAESLLNTANPKTGDRVTGEPPAPAARADRADADRADRADRAAQHRRAAGQGARHACDRISKRARATRSSSRARRTARGRGSRPSWSRTRCHSRP